MSRSIFSATAAGVCSALTLCCGALAQGYDDPGAAEQVILKVKNADLRSPSGAKEAALRVRVAADKVCGGDRDPVLRSGDGFGRCREAAIDRAIGSVDAPLLAEALGRSPTLLALGG
jgi:UrcA family protein